MATINKENILSKLAAIAAKDTAKITAAKVYIPYLGDKYTEPELIAWLQKRTDYYNKLLGFEGKDADATAEKDILYTALSVAERALADKIVAGNDNVKFASEEEWENLVKVRMYRHVTEPKLITTEEI